MSLPFLVFFRNPLSGVSLICLLLDLRTLACIDIQGNESRFVTHFVQRFVWSSVGYFLDINARF